MGNKNTKLTGAKGKIGLGQQKRVGKVNVPTKKTNVRYELKRRFKLNGLNSKFLKSNFKGQ